MHFFSTISGLFSTFGVATNHVGSPSVGLNNADVGKTSGGENTIAVAGEISGRGNAVAVESDIRNEGAKESKENEKVGSKVQPKEDVKVGYKVKPITAVTAPVSYWPVPTMGTWLLLSLFLFAISSPQFVVPGFRSPGLNFRLVQFAQSSWLCLSNLLKILKIHYCMKGFLRRIIWISRGATVVWRATIV